MLSSYLVIGAIAGIMSGLLGVGGGIIVVPALSAIFANSNAIPANIAMQMAIGTSLAVMIATLAASIYTHHQHKAVKWALVKRVVPGLVVGAILGAMIASSIPSGYLKIFFSLFILYVGLQLIFKKNRLAEGRVFTRYAMFIIAVLIGILSSLLGMGGGIMLVPFFMHCNLDIREAMGTSVAAAMVIACVSTLSFMISGSFAVPQLSGCIGYIYLPAWFGIAAASLLFAPIGAILAHRLPRELLRRIFGVFLIMMAADMLLIR